MSAINIAKDTLRIPEQGELVEVYRRQRLVSDIKPYHPDGDCYREQHAVTLESIEEDANGEQITAIWQIGKLHEELAYSGAEMKPDFYCRKSVLRDCEKLMDLSHPYDDIPDYAFGIFKRLAKLNKEHSEEEEKAGLHKKELKGVALK